MRTVITSADRSLISFAELRQFRGLLKYLSLRDVFVRYKQTRMGYAWSVFRPAINIAIFGTLSFLVDRSGNFTDRFIEVSAAIILWQLISTTITEVSNALINNSNILTKVYFPKILLPMSAIMVCLIDFLIAFALFLPIYVGVKGWPPMQIVLVPLVVCYCFIFSFALGLIFATASVKYRDVKFILPFLLQILFYISPVFLSSRFILDHNMPQILKVVYQFNPLVFALNAWKYCFSGVFESYNPMFAGISIAITALLLVVSLKYFLNFEKSFADYI
jgi:lipopolysaccharide transport system permease protein